MPQSLTFGVFPLGLAGSPDGVAAGSSPKPAFERLRGLFRELR